ncbi:hypothetical protein [Streptomyces cacaoi]
MTSWRDEAAAGASCEGLFAKRLDGQLGERQGLPKWQLPFLDQHGVVFVL